MKLRRAILVCAVLLGTDALAAHTSLSASTRYPMGYIPAEESIFSELPKVPRYRAFLPPKIDLSKNFPTPGMQVAESCSGWAVGYAARSYYTKTVDGRDTEQLSNVPSPSYIYNQIRSRNNCSSGAMLLDALAVLGKGALSGDEFPMHTCRIPTLEERERATDFRIKKWTAVDPKQLDDVKGQLARGNPVIVGLDVRVGFEELRGDVVYRSSAEKVGKHALTLVGYDDQRQAYRLINSWGTMWGDKGFGWIDYELFKVDAREAYVIEVATEQEKISDERVVAPQIASDDSNAVPSRPEEVPTPTIKPAPPVSPKQEVNNPSPPIERPSTDGDCSYVYSEMKSGRSKLLGFVNAEGDLKSLGEIWNGLADDIEVEVRPWPQCEVLLNVAAILNDGSGLVVDTWDGTTTFKEGQEMAFELKTPAMPQYIYAFYIQADGSVIKLLEPKSEFAPSLRGEVLLFGSGADGSPRFKVTQPFGREMVLALSSSSPLFDKKVPQVQTEREFLSALRRAMIYKPDHTNDERQISAAFVGVTTEAK